jgi:peptide chain release factor 2
MLDLEENLRILNTLIEKLNSLNETLDISSLKRKLEQLKKQSEQDGFWNDKENSNKVFTEIKKLERKINSFEEIKINLDNLIEMNQLLLSEYDEELAKDLIEHTKIIDNKLNTLELETLLSGKYDSNNAILTLHPGAGGTESQDWVEMLYRMYAKWASSNGFTLKELDYLEGEEAGIKSVTFIIAGENAYGYLKGEMGVHRLVRISPFDAGGRRHTSFASVEVLPEITDDIEININPDDLRVDTYRASRSWRSTY